WYGGSFSMRAVIQYYAILLFPLCAIITWLVRRWWRAVLFGVFFLFCVWLNLMMTYQANCKGIMESDNMTKTYFWKIFGKLQENKEDKKFIETDEEIPANLLPRLQLISTQA